MATRRGPDNSVRVGISGTIQGVAWANVFWAALTLSGTPSQSDLDTWLTAFQNSYKTRLGARIQSTALFVQAQAALFLTGGGFLPSIVPMTGAGTQAATATVPQDAASVLSWQTGVYWRGGKPRTYLPLPAAADIVTNNSLSASAIATNVTAANGLRTDVNALTSGAITGTQLGFVSFFTAGALRSPPLFYAYTGVKCHPRVGSQRRRLGKWRP